MIAGLTARDPAAVSDVPGLDELPAASALLSSRWSRDNLVTSHPGRLYDGAVLEELDVDALEGLLPELVATKGPLELGAVRMGVFTWDVACADARGRFVLQLPRVLDEPGRRGRAKRDVPRQNHDNMRAFIAQGLTRFVVEPRELVTLAGGVTGALFDALPSHHRLSFARGRAQIEIEQGPLAWFVAMSAATTAELLSEVVAALVYHYDPALDGGTAITDVCVNDGDFAVSRRADGSFALRLSAVRRREPGIAPNLLLLYLVQLMGYEDFSIADSLVGLPISLGNPSLAFAGVSRGLRQRYRDLGLSEQDARAEATRWITDFGRSREGRAYRPWVERFLRGELPPSFGAELRERWWRLMSLETKLGLLDLRARYESQPRVLAEAQALRAFLERLGREIGRSAPEEPDTLRVNELGREQLLALLDEAQLPKAEQESIAEAFFQHWPYRSLEQLTARVPGARKLRRLKRRLSCGEIVTEAAQGTLESFAPAGKDAETPRPLANHEIFGALSLPPGSAEAALRHFPSFEAYMDAALHDERWGYYAHSVRIGRAGHFDTHPESLSPHYGQWLAVWLFKAWQDLVAHGELGDSDPFTVLEFGAGNGRLARDVLDSVQRSARQARAEPRWQEFARRLSYRVYETSAALRQEQQRLLAADAAVFAGDARHPSETLKRDFAGGFKGVVLTNEVPDAFGVHKVVLAADGRAFAALVVPRVEPWLKAALEPETSARVEAVNDSLRRSLALTSDSDDFYLDASTFAEVMPALARLAPDERERLQGGLRFREAYVPASLIPELAAHFSANAEQYAIALAARPSGVVTYVNLHAERFVRELGSALQRGFVITIDYGESLWGLIQGARRGEFPFRVYGEWQEYVPRPNDPYAAPGMQDLTADVNFTALARAGRESGLEVVHFGLERDVVGDDLLRALAAAETQAPFAKFLGNPLFKVLVQGRRTTEAFTSRFHSPLPLTYSERDVPKARRGEIARIQRVLAALGAS